jgi:hypothetical protein
MCICISASTLHTAGSQREAYMASIYDTSQLHPSFDSRESPFNNGPP